MKGKGVVEGIGEVGCDEEKRVMGCSPRSTDVGGGPAADVMLFRVDVAVSLVRLQRCQLGGEVKGGREKLSVACEFLSPSQASLLSLFSLFSLFPCPALLRCDFSANS